MLSTIEVGIGIQIAQAATMRKVSTLGIGDHPVGNAVLSVSPHHEDHKVLKRIVRESSRTLKLESTFIASENLALACCVLRDKAISVLVCESELLPGTWREMVEQISVLPNPPLLIVTSRLADDHLWAEALNLGAWDVLAKPFNATELIRTMVLALQHWQARHKLRLIRAEKKMGATEE